MLKTSKLFTKLLLPLIALMLAACNLNGTNDEPDTTPPPQVETPDTPQENPNVETPSDNSTDDVIEDDYSIPETFNPNDYTLIDVFPELRFNEPLALTHNETNGDLVYVVERQGHVYSVSLSNPQNKTLFLDLSDVVNTSGQEMGLLGLAFHPQYEDNGYLFVNYTTENETIISRFTSLNQEAVNLSSEKVLLTYSQPYRNHNGGSLLFGEDGYLYIASGDGGSGGDPQDYAQNLESYLGKLLRIDVNSEDETFLIPDSNPFVENEEGVKKEIYAYGLRNPWKFSFDPGRDLLIAADVGQGEIEEINLIRSGGNYGWNRFEGSQPFKAGSPIENHIPPIYEYPHSEGRSITGGFTYYGRQLESLRGAYIYGDFISGRIWALWLDDNLDATNYDLLDTDLMISSFGLDKNNEIYIIDFQGKIYTLEEN